jgi:hypothetical protein
MNDELNEVAGIPNERYFKEFVQVGGITGQRYHFKFKTKEQYLAWLAAEAKMVDAYERLSTMSINKNEDQ